MSPTPRYCTTQQAQRWETLSLPLDRYGETPCFACLECGAEDTLKVSVPINLGHCTACGWGTSADRLAARLEGLQRIAADVANAPRPGEVLPTTTVQRV